MMRIKTILLVLVTFVVVLPMNAADSFVTFAEQNGAVSLRGATIGYSDNEPKWSRLAAWRYHRL